MSTEGIKKDIVITDKKAAKKLVEALERAEEIATEEQNNIIQNPPRKCLADRYNFR